MQAFFFGLNFAVVAHPCGGVVFSPVAKEPIQVAEIARPVRKHGGELSTFSVDKSVKFFRRSAIGAGLQAAIKNRSKPSLLKC